MCFSASGGRACRGCILRRSILWRCGPKARRWGRRRIGFSTLWVSVHLLGRAFVLFCPESILTLCTVVEITPPGIENLHWRFYIIWTVFNFAFITIGKPSHPLHPYPLFLLSFLSPFPPPNSFPSLLSVHLSPYPHLTQHGLPLLPRNLRPHPRRHRPLLRRPRAPARISGQGSDAASAAAPLPRAGEGGAGAECESSACGWEGA